jgi:hypothetical protein
LDFALRAAKGEVALFGRLQMLKDCYCHVNWRPEVVVADSAKDGVSETVVLVVRFLYYMRHEERENANAHLRHYFCWELFGRQTTAAAEDNKAEYSKPGPEQMSPERHAHEDAPQNRQY